MFTAKLIEARSGLRSVRPFARLVFVLSLTVPWPAGAQAPRVSVPPVPAGPPAPVAPEVVARDGRGGMTIRSTRLAEPIVVDGKLDDPVYQSVPPVSDFIQQEPHAGEAATEKTEVWFFHDNQTFYLSARCWDSHPERSVVGDLRRDGQSFSTVESIMIAVDTFYDHRNGYGFSVNSLGGYQDQQITNEKEFNRDWNTVWDSRVGRFPGGWTLEIAIPFKSMRYPPGPQVWGIQVRRVVRWKNEMSHLTPVPTSAGLISVFRFSSEATLVGIDAPATSRNIEVKPYGLAGFRTDRKVGSGSTDIDRNGGVDMKYGVTRGLTADFTYRTDFAQVEDDTQQVNLTRFNLFYPERREFFLEGQGIFNVGGLPSTPGDTPVLFFSRRIGLENGRPVPFDAGGRLTGKAGPYTVGFINTQTGDAPASGARATNFTVVRAKRDILRRSSIGALYTRRSVSAAGPGANDVYAVDGVFSFFQNLVLNTYVARTSTPGRSNDDLSYRGQLDYKGDRYGLQLERTKVGADFNPEVGFLRRRDFVRHFGYARFSPRPQGNRIIRRVLYEAIFDEFTNGRSRVVSRQVEGAYRIEFQNGDKFGFEYDRNDELIESPFAIASNVTIPAGGYPFQEIHLTHTLDTVWPVSGTFGFEQGSFYGGSRRAVTYTGGRVALTPRLWLYPGLSLNRVDLPQGSFRATAASLRGIYTFTPRLFVAAFGQYRSDSHAFTTNLRLRWEYRPGSELFVVYNEGRNTLATSRLALDNRALIVKLTRLVRF